MEDQCCEVIPWHLERESLGVLGSAHLALVGLELSSLGWGGAGHPRQACMPENLMPAPPAVLSLLFSVTSYLLL